MWFMYMCDDVQYLFVSQGLFTSGVNVNLIGKLINVFTNSINLIKLTKSFFLFFDILTINKANIYFYFGI